MAVIKELVKTINVVRTHELTISIILEQHCINAYIRQFSALLLYKIIINGNTDQCPFYLHQIEIYLTSLFSSTNQIAFSLSLREFTCVNFLNSVLQRNLSEHFTCFSGFSTALKVSKYGVFCGPHFPAFGVNMER